MHRKRNNKRIWLGAVFCVCTLFAAGLFAQAGAAADFSLTETISAVFHLKQSENEGGAEEPVELLTVTVTFDLGEVFAEVAPFTGAAGEAFPGEGYDDAGQYQFAVGETYTGTDGKLYRFDGWVIAPALEGWNITDAVYPAEDVTLTAEWTQLVRVRFDLGEAFAAVGPFAGLAGEAFPGEGYEDAEQYQFTVGETYTGTDGKIYRFGGWSITPEIEDWDIASAVYPAEDVTLTAEWTQLVRVRFDLGEAFAAVGPFTGLAGEAFPGEEYKDAGQYQFTVGETYTGTDGKIYRFDGWSITPEIEDWDIADAVYPTEDITLTAQWTHSVTVTFGLGEMFAAVGPFTGLAGEAFPGGDYEDAGYQFTVGEAYTGTDGREYRFDGWEIVPETEEWDLSAALYPMQDVTLTAKWSRIVTVTFDLGEAFAAVGPFKGVVGEAFPGNADAGQYLFTIGEAYSGTDGKSYRFDGHSYAPSGDWTPGSEIFPEQDVAITAAFARRYTVTFDYGVEIFFNPADQTDCADQNITFPAAPSRLGYTGGYWALKGTTQEVSQPFAFAEGLEFVFIWTPATNIAYKVRHLAQDTKGSYSAPVTLETENKNNGVTESTVSASNPDYEKSYTGFTFDAEKNAESSVVILADGSSVLNVYYSRNTYILSKKLDGVEIPVSNSYYFGAFLPGAPAHPGVKSGFTFSGWTVTSQTTMPAEDFCYATGYYTRNSYTLVFHYQDANGNPKSEQKTLVYGNAVTVPNAARVGYTYVWSPAVPAMAQDGMATVFNAIYTPKSFNILFTAPDAQDYMDVSIPTLFDSAITQPADLPEREGYRLVGWSYNGTVYALGDLGALKSEGERAYSAVWSKIYTAAFDFGLGGENYSTQGIAGETIAYPAPPSDQEKPGYHFDGWQQEGQEAALTFTEQDEFFTAKWSPNTDTLYTVRFLSQNTDMEGYESVVLSEIRTGVTDSEVLASAFADYTLEGFLFDSEKNEQGTITILGDGSAVLEVYYTREVYELQFELNGTVQMYIAEYAYGKTLPEDPDIPPIQAGHTFSGWQRDESTGNTMPARDFIFVSGEHVINRYTLTFEHWDTLQEKLVTTMKTVAYQEEITVPNASRVGYYMEWEPAIPGNAYEGMPTVFTAKYTPKQYYVTFKDPLNSAYHMEAYVAYNQAIMQPEVLPAHEDYRLIAWRYAGVDYTPDALGVLSTLDSENERIYTAVYARLYKATFHYSLEGIANPEPFYGIQDEQVQLPANMLTVRPGYTPQWTAETFSDGDITYTADWVVRDDMPYQVQRHYMDLNGAYTQAGTETENLPGTFGQKAFELAQLKAQTPTGFTLDEAKSTKDFTITADNNLVFHIYYERNLYTLTFQYQKEKIGATDGTYETVTHFSGKVYYGAAISNISLVSPTGYNAFSGWSPVIASGATMPAANVTYTGKIDLKRNTVTFNINSVFYQSKTYKYGDTITAPSYTAGSGYKFTGWTVGSAAMGETARSFNAALTIYYTVETYTMGTDGKYGSAKIETKDAVEGATVTLTASPGTGFRQDASKTHVLSGVIKKPSESTVTLKIYYERLKYNAVFNSFEKSETKTLYYGQSITKPADPHTKSQTFTGWKPSVPDTMPAENTIYEAQYSPKQLKSYVITDNPTQVIVGKILNLNGTKLQCTFDNGSIGSQEITVTQSMLNSGEVTFTPKSFAKTGKQTVTVTYQGVKKSFQVQVIERSPSKLAFSPDPKNTYAKGEKLDLSIGKLVVSYNNDTKETYALTNSKIKISGYSASKLGTQTLTLTYTEKDTVLTKKFTVTVQEKATYLKGDANLDGKITAVDALFIRQHYLKIKLLTGDALKAADVDGNGVITAMDVLMVRQDYLKMKAIKQ